MRFAILKKLKARLPCRIPQTASDKSISSTSNLNESFKVQDVKDFNDRVKNSKVPVIVDFFAT